MSSTVYTLLQFSADPWNARFEDLESRLAFTMCVCSMIVLVLVYAFLFAEIH